MGNEAYGDIRTLSPEEHWDHFAKSWIALQSYTYLGPVTAEDVSCPTLTLLATAVLEPAEVEN